MIVVETKMKGKREADEFIHLPESYPTWTQKSSPMRLARLEIANQGNPIHPVLKNLNAVDSSLEVKATKIYPCNSYSSNEWTNRQVSTLHSTVINHHSVRPVKQDPYRKLRKAFLGREHLHFRFKAISRISIAPLLPYLKPHSLRVGLKNTVLQGVKPLLLPEASALFNKVSGYLYNLSAIATGITLPTDASRIIQPYTAMLTKAVAITYITLDSMIRIVYQHRYIIRSTIIFI
jgi:hypothetical protein